ncbi:MAG: ABC transporter permease [Planctomycetota bacterium]|nr:ABC transporter permease [Planctomycetota bacterium]
MYKLFLSVRYLKARKINLMSVAGVLLGVMAMIVILSVMKGFGVELRERIRGTLSHIIVRAPFEIAEQEEVIKKIRSVEHVVAAAPYIETLGLIQVEGMSTWAMIRGIDPDAEATVGEIRRYASKTLRVAAGNDLGERYLLGDKESILIGRQNPKTSVDIELEDEKVKSRHAEIILDGHQVRILAREGVVLIDGQKAEGALLKHTDLITLGGTNILFQDDFEIFKQEISETNILMQLPEVAPPEEEVGPGLPSVGPVLPDGLFDDEAGDEQPQEKSGNTENAAEKDQGEDGLEFLNGIYKGLPKVTSAATPPLLMGQALLPYFQRGTGVQIVAPAGFMEFTPMDFHLAGRFKTGNYENDSRSIYIPLKDAQKLIGLQNKVSGISVRLDDFRLADQVVDNISKAIGPGFTVETWEAQRAILLAAIDNERNVMAVVLMFISIVAGFCIMATLWMMVVERTRDIGILKSIGGTSAGVMSIFLLNGTLIGLLGAILGTVCGLGFLRIMNPLADLVEIKTGWHPFPKSLYYLDGIPAATDPMDVAVIASAAVIISFMAAFYPARRAAGMDPITAIRYE